MSRENLSVKLAERPITTIIPGTTFRNETAPAPTDSDLKDGQVLVESLYLSLDPAMRGWMSDRRSYLPPVQIGETMRGAAVCRVLASKSSQAKEGDHVVGYPGWTEVAILSEGQFEPSSALPKVERLTDYLSVLGTTGLTAFFGLDKIGQPKPGELVVVSGAAGATGSLVGQIAKIRGARVVGIAGGDDKCAWLKELGFDVALNYKDPSFKENFKEATKDYIDVYWDNVGGEILDMALARAKPFARFVMCGAISQYTAGANIQGPKNILSVISMRIRMQGFIVLDHRSEYPRARKDLAQWLDEGKIQRRETIVKGGLQVAEQALVDLFKGTNTGKMLVEVKNPNESAKL